MNLSNMTKMKEKIIYSFFFAHSHEAKFIEFVLLGYIYIFFLLQDIYIYILALIPARCRGLFFFIKNILKNKN